MSVQYKRPDLTPVWRIQPQGDEEGPEAIDFTPKGVGHVLVQIGKQQTIVNATDLLQAAARAEASAYLIFDK